MPISKQNAKRAGKDFERNTRAALRQNGYMVIMSAGSLTACDMVAVKWGEILFIQCKAGVASNGTLGLISPGERAELLAFAKNAGDAGKAIVAYQQKIGRAHALMWKRLDSEAADAWSPWTPDEVAG